MSDYATDPSVRENLPSAMLRASRPRNEPPVPEVEQDSFTHPVDKGRNFAAPLPSQERLNEPSGFYRVYNSSPVQTFIVIDRNMIGVELRPHETKEIEMTNHDAQHYNELSKPGRLRRDGRLAEQHPIRMLDLRPSDEEKRIKEMVEERVNDEFEKRVQEEIEKRRKADIEKGGERSERVTLQGKK